MFDPANPEKGVEDRNRPAWIYIGNPSKGDPNVIFIRYVPGLTPDQYTKQLTQEIFHIFQKESGIMSMVNNNHSPLEYQETAMQAIDVVIRSGTPIWNLLGSQTKDFENWIKTVVQTVIHDDVVDYVVDYDEFIKGIGMCYGSFVAANKKKDPKGYGQDQRLKYKDAIANLKWKEVLEWYGYTIK